MLEQGTYLEVSHNWQILGTGLVGRTSNYIGIRKSVSGKIAQANDNRTIVRMVKETQFKVTIRASYFAINARNTIWELVS